MGPLSKNQYPIHETKKIPNMLALILHLQDDEEDVSNDGESLFTHIPIEVDCLSTTLLNNATFKKS